MNDESEEREIIEDVLGEFGFRLKWKVLAHWANVSAFEIEGREDDTNLPLFHKLDAPTYPDNVYDIRDAEEYLSGYVKWDGCSELDQGCPHWCGPIGYIKHIRLLKYIYKRAFELMDRDEWESWDEAEKEKENED